ncbi:MAG TPA: hypothetical protein DCL44_11400 [Elusimicrobia bacterium]|nr:hypothetical protein [Elusimicrobiota bacterium]
MTEDNEKKEFYQRLIDIVGEREVGIILPSHKVGKCDEGLIISYLSGGMPPAKMKVAEEKIFSCSKCTLLAIELARATEGIKDDCPQGTKLDHEGFVRWRERFEKEHLYTVNKKYGKTDLKFTANGWDARIDNAKEDFRVRVGKKTYAPTNDGIITYPDTPDAVLESADGPTVNIHEFSGGRK